MPKGIKAWIQFVVHEPLPQLRRTSQVLRRLARYNDPELARIIEVIQQDCGFSIQLLRHMSEVKTTRQIVQITTLEQALVMLGSTRVFKLAEELPVVEDLLDGDQLLGYMGLAARSFHAARQALDWARVRGDSKPEELALAAFLYDLAGLVLWRFGGEEMSRLEQLSRLDQFDEIGPSKPETEILGFEMLALGRELAKRWRLPSLVYTCQHPLSALDPRTLGPILAAKLARAVQRGWYHPGALELVNMVGDYLHWSAAQGASRVHVEAVNTSRTVDFHGVTPVATGLLYSGEIPQIIAPSERELRKAGAPIKRQEPQTEVKVATTVAEPPASDLTVYHRTLEQLHKQNLSVHSILKTALNGMHMGLGLPRVLFAVLTPEKRALIVRYGVGVEHDPRFKGVLLTLTPPNLLTRMLEKPQALWVNEGNMDKLWPHVPKGLRELIRVKTFYMMSVFVSGKPLGMFYADKAGSAGGLEQAGFLGFKSIGALTGQALARARNHVKAQKKSVRR